MRQIEFGPAQECLQAILARFANLGELSDVNVGNGQVAVRAAGRSIPVDIAVGDDEIAELGSLMASALDQELTAGQPTLSKFLPPRWRVTVTHPTITKAGRWSLSVRVLPTRVIPIAQYVEDGYLEPAAAARILQILHSKATTLVCGATSSGKTTLLRALIGELPEHERLVIVEDTAELAVERPNTESLLASDHFGFTELVRHTLRTDPDRIIIGEIRGKEALDMVDAANTGHAGTLTTVHSHGREKALLRLLRLCRRADERFDAAELEDAVDAVVQIEVDPLTGRRQVSLWEAA